MAYTEKQKSNIVDVVCAQVILGKTLRAAFESQGISSITFYKWLEQDEEKAKQYARARDIEADLMADEIKNIADSTKDDIVIDENGNEVINHNVIQRDRLRVDARKWLMSKRAPKKYGDKQNIDLTTKGEHLIFNPLDLDVRE